MKSVKSVVEDLSHRNIPRACPRPAEAGTPTFRNSTGRAEYPANTRRLIKDGVPWQFGRRKDRGDRARHVLPRMQIRYRGVWGPREGNAKIITPTVLRTLLAGLVPGRHSCVHQCVVRHMEHLGPIAPAAGFASGREKQRTNPTLPFWQSRPAQPRPGNLQNEATIIRVERIVAIGRTVSCRERPGGSCEPSNRSHDYRGGSAERAASAPVSLNEPDISAGRDGVVGAAAGAILRVSDPAAYPLDSAVGR